jgi:hypothetical protein
MMVAAGIVIVLLFVLDFKTLKGPWFYPAAMLLSVYLFLRARIAGWAESNGKIFALIAIGVALLSMAGALRCMRRWASIARNAASGGRCANIRTPWSMPDSSKARFWRRPSILRETCAACSRSHAR